MKLQLSNSERYRKDIKSFNQALLKITNPKLKQEFESLMAEFKKYSTLIDEEHNPTNNGYINPARAHESVDRLASVRYKLYKIVNDLNS